MDKETRNIITTAVAAAVTVALPFFRVHPLIALLFGVASFFVVRDLLPLSQQIERKDSPELRPGADNGEKAASAPETVESPLNMAEQAAAQFAELAQAISDRATARNVDEISRLVRRLVQDFREDPEDLRLPAAQTFLHTNLDRALRLVESYTRLSNMEFPPDANDPHSAERERSLRDAEEAIELTRQGFLALLTECHENDRRQMDMDSHVLTRMLEDRFPQLAEAERRAVEQQQRHDTPPAAPDKS